MFKLYSKIFSTPKTVIPIDALDCSQSTFEVGQKIEHKVKKLFKGSLAIREVDAGSTNAEEQELTALGNAFYDCERFGVHIVASPRHADMLLVTGPVSRNMVEGLKRTYNATPEPKIVVAVGDGAINGGLFAGSYAIHTVEEVIPVHFKIPGDPPSPKTVLCTLLKILEVLDDRGLKK